MYDNVSLLAVEMPQININILYDVCFMFCIFTFYGKLKLSFPFIFLSKTDYNYQ
jgi:hypothetical protein